MVTWCPPWLLCQGLLLNQWRQQQHNRLSRQRLVMIMVMMMVMVVMVVVVMVQYDDEDDDCDYGDDCDAMMQ